MRGRSTALRVTADGVPCIGHCKGPTRGRAAGRRTAVGRDQRWVDCCPYWYRSRSPRWCGEARVVDHRVGGRSERRRPVQQVGGRPSLRGVEQQRAVKLAHRKGRHVDPWGGPDGLEREARLEIDLDDVGGRGAGRLEAKADACGVGVARARSLGQRCVRGGAPVVARIQVSVRERVAHRLAHAHRVLCVGVPAGRAGGGGRHCRLHENLVVVSTQEGPSGRRETRKRQRCENLTPRRDKGSRVLEARRPARLDSQQPGAQGGDTNVAYHLHLLIGRRFYVHAAPALPSRGTQGW